MCCSSTRRPPTPYMSAKKRKEQIANVVDLLCVSSPGKWRRLCCVCSEKIDPLRWRVPLSQIEARRHLPEGCGEIMRSQGTKSDGRSTCGKTAVDKSLTIGLVLNHVANAIANNAANVVLAGFPIADLCVRNYRRIWVENSWSRA